MALKNKLIILIRRDKGFMTETMSNALDLMAVGMGFVFSFLIILVLTTMLMSALVRRFAPEEPSPAPGKSGGAGADKPADDAQLTAVISAAISKYRHRHKK